MKMRTIDVPQSGQLVRVRQRQYFVEEVAPPGDGDDSTLVRMSCLDDDAQGQPLEVLWEKEIDPEIITAEAWQDIAARGFDPPKVFSAYLHTLQWNCVTSTDPSLFQSPFRAGIRIDAYQLEPLRKALRLPRVNLFIADDVGLGKTIEAGLIARELLLRKKVQDIVVACPPSMLFQWQDELEIRFGMVFQILDKDYIARVRRERGYGVNPWTTHTRFLVSHRLLIDEAYTATLRDWLGDFRPGSLLILDEAHHAAPASGAKYAIDSKFTRAIRDIAGRFEHRLVPLGDTAQRPLQQLLGSAGNPRSPTLLPGRDRSAQAPRRGHGPTAQGRPPRDRRRLPEAHREATGYRRPTTRHAGTDASPSCSTSIGNCGSNDSRARRRGNKLPRPC